MEEKLFHQSEEHLRADAYNRLPLQISIARHEHETI